MPLEADPFERAASTAPPRPEAFASFQKMDVDTEQQRRAERMQREIEEEWRQKRQMLIAIACVLLIVAASLGMKNGDAGNSAAPLNSIGARKSRGGNPHAQRQIRVRHHTHPTPAPTPKPKSYHFPASYEEALRHVELTLDPTIDPCNDFYQYACGGWLKTQKLKPTQSRVVRTFTQIFDHNEAVSKEILDSPDGGGPYLKTYYKSCMDLQSMDALGAKPINRWLGLIDETSNLLALMYVMGTLFQTGTHAFVQLHVDPDPKRATVNCLWVDQGSLGMPDRSFYVKKTKVVKFKHTYISHVATMLRLADPADFATEKDAQSAAVKIYALEKAMATIIVPRTQLMDPLKFDNQYTLKQLNEEAPNLAWDSFFQGAGIPLHPHGKPLDLLVVGVTSPSYLRALSKLLHGTPIDTLKIYAKFRVVRNWGSMLSQPLRDEHFAFYDAALSGETAQKPRWKTCVALCNMYLRDELARRFVRKTFSGASKREARQLVADIESAFKANLQELDWMGPTAKAHARHKLSMIHNLVGFPDHFLDYSSLKLSPHAMLANTMQATKLQTRIATSKLGVPVDRRHWDIGAAIVNAYYDRSRNVMVFPAGLLQPFFFNSSFPPVLNFGGIGMIMGHELTHGFDAVGRKFDGTGSLVAKGLWPKPTVAQFQARAQCFEKQYGSFVERVPDPKAPADPKSGTVAGKVNGKLTINENIADNGGVKLSFKAFQAYNARQKRMGRELPNLIGALTNEQLYFVAFAQNWCQVQTQQAARQQLATDFHSPADWRVRGTLMNNRDFARVFQCPAGSPMNPQHKCELW